MKIIKRPLTDDEITSIIHETEKAPHLGFMSFHLWRWFPVTYVAMNKDTFVGVCAIYPLSQSIKLGPIMILPNHQGLGIGKKLLTYVVRQNSYKNLYIGSSNKKIYAIVRSRGFHEVPFRDLTFEIQVYLIKYFFIRLSIAFIINELKKYPYKKGAKYRYFLRTKSV